MTGGPIVYVVDDDSDVRDSLQVLLEYAGFSVRAFDSALKFLASDLAEIGGCLVVDIRMPGMDGLELQDELVKRRIGLPVIVITGHGDVPLAVRAMRAGAIDFIEKPFREEALVDSIRHALNATNARRDGAEREEARACLETLTERETQVLNLVVDGHTTKEAARLLDISPRTIDIHRSHIMEKMRANSLADLVRITLLCRSR